MKINQDKRIQFLKKELAKETDELEAKKLAKELCVWTDAKKRGIIS